MTIPRCFVPLNSNKSNRPVVALLFGVLSLATPAVGLSDDTTFKDILKSVQNRESRTGAILTIAASAEQRAKGAPATYSYFEIRIKDKTAQVEMYNNYLTGKKGESYVFPLGPEIEAEHARLQNLARLRELDSAVADAERRRRIFVLSSFQLQEGSGVEQIETVFGKPVAVNYWMKAGWATLVFCDVNVVTAFDKVHDIQSSHRD